MEREQDVGSDVTCVCTECQVVNAVWCVFFAVRLSHFFDELTQGEVEFIGRARQHVALEETRLRTSVRKNNNKNNEKQNEPIEKEVS